MAHNVETMAYAGELPWHGLGKKVGEDLTPNQILIEAGLDWAVEKQPLYYKDPFADNQFVKINEKEALIRLSDGRLLDVVGDGWNPLQNIDAFNFFDQFIKAGEMQMHTAGSLRRGQIVWALARINDSFEVVSGDKVDSYLLFTNPHKFGAAIDVRFTPIRVVCNNTLSFALEGASSKFVKVNHRTEFDPDDVKEVLGVARNKLAKYKEVSQFLISKKIGKDAFERIALTHDYFQQVFPKTSDKKGRDLSRRAEDAVSIIHNQPGMEFGEGTWWNAFNTVTYMVDHKVGRSIDTRLTSAWFGQNKIRKEKALTLAVEYAKAS